MILICTIAVKYQYEFIIVELVAGLVAIYSLRELSQRAQLFKTAVLVTLACSAVYFAMQLMTDNTFSTVDNSMYKYFVINGILLLFAYPLMLIIEKMFGSGHFPTFNNGEQPRLRHCREDRCQGAAREDGSPVS